MSLFTSRSLVSLSFAGFLAVPAVAQFNFAASDGTFVPGFRGEANTYHFGWDRGTFDGSNANGLLDDPEITLGDTSLDPLVSLTADPAAIISSTGNLYKNGSTLDASLVVPTPGSLGTGFTTIILQGGGVRSPYSQREPVFPEVLGVTPEVVVASNATGRGQFWAKYEFVGNAGEYVLSIAGTNPPNIPSIAELQVDVLWSANAFASDSAVAIPEPTSLAALGAAGLLLRRRRA